MSAVGLVGLLSNTGAYVATENMVLRSLSTEGTECFK